MFWQPTKTKISTDENMPISLTPGSLRRWIKALPMADMGKAPRIVYNALIILNKSELPPEQRIQNMELMRDATQAILHHLSRHFIARTLPLPPRGRKIFRLLLRLHKELSSGYRLILDAMADDHKLNQKLSALAIHRALRHMGLMHFQTAQMYETEPAGMWREIHQLYAFAETYGLTEVIVRDNTFHKIKRSSISEVYRQIILLALARPSGLRQGEAKQLNIFFENNAGLLKIDIKPVIDAYNGVYVVNLELDRPPAYVMFSEIPLIPSLRGISPDKMLIKLREQLQTTTAQDTENTDINELPPELARRLLLTLTQHAKRDFARADRDENIFVAIGLDAIHRAIQADPERTSLMRRSSHPPEPSPDSNRELTLQTISDQHRHYNSDPTEYYDPNATNEDIWGLVINDSLWHQADISQHSAGSSMDGVDVSQSPPQEWSRWRLLNASPGGYCICWDQPRPAGSQVGEIMALREREARKALWRIGIIRWMRNMPGDQGLMVGIQLLAANCYQITAYCNQLGQLGKGAIDALLLPAIKALRQPGSLILPAGHFYTGDEVLIREGQTETSVKLQECLQSSSNFLQFMISSIDTDVSPSAEI